MVKELTVSARYPDPPDATFAKARSFAEMAEASRGMASYRDMPEGAMEAGQTYTINVTVWGVMRNPHYKVHVETVDPATRRIQSREHGWMIRQWDHTLSVDPDGDGSRWTDRIVIDCAWATGFMAWVAKRLYLTRHRNRGGAGIRATLRRV
jgi:hypothetical protein